MIKLLKILTEKNKGLWANIHAKRKRGEKSDPRSKSYKAAKKAGQKINRGEGIEELFVREEDIQCFTEWLGEAANHITEAEYQGRTVKLNKPMQGDTAKFKVYVKDGDKVKKVNFGAKGSKNRIKKNNPERRKSFRARHNCDNPGPKTKARYWSCRKW
tara:strand:- start:1546 stop:2019 length:474 start_codon:yes stop_codon:yes gene_type:complete